MRTHVIPALVATTLCVATAPGHAAEGRSYLDLRLLGTMDGGGFREDAGQDGSISASVDDGLGWGIRGAWEFAPRWHVYGDWGVSNTSLKVRLRDGSGAVVESRDSDFDMTRASLGFGYSWPVGQDWDIYGRVTWDYVEYGDFDTIDLTGLGRVSIDDEDDSGVGATVGARWYGGAWELEAWGRYTQVGELTQDGDGVEFDNDFGGGARAVYHFGENWSAGADYELADIDTWSAFVRYRF
jgi:hypothetical protein